MSFEWHSIAEAQEATTNERLLHLSNLAAVMVARLNASAIGSLSRARVRGSMPAAPCIYRFIASALILGVAGSASAQEAEIRGKTILYTMTKAAPGQIYVAPSGNVYWSFQPEV